MELLPTLTGRLFFRCIFCAFQYIIKYSIDMANGLSLQGCFLTAPLRSTELSLYSHRVTQA